MSGSIKKEINFIIEIAKNINEADLQQRKEYQNIKSRKSIPGKELLKLMGALEELNFDEESIFWNERALETCINTKDRFDTYLG